MLDQYRNKKIGILGFALEGKSTFDFFKKHGITSAILDQKTKDEFLKDNPELSPDVESYLGQDYLKSLDKFDLIVKTPGISPLHPDITKAKEAGVVFTSQIEIFFELAKGMIIGVTGTKGKGTTSTLIANILGGSGKDAYLGGNIGVPAISFVDQLKDNSISVLELSSFHLQVLNTSPHIAVVLNVTSDHMDYHKNIEEYRDAKKNITRFQSSEDYLVLNADYEVASEFTDISLAGKYYVSSKKMTNGCFVDNYDQIVLIVNDKPEKIVKTNELLLRGSHNLENVTAAVMATYLAGANLESIATTVKKFKGLEHRLELVAETNGIRYYNDSFSTIPETSIAAINAFSEPKIVILGGSDKGSDYSDLGKKIAEANVKAIIIIGDMADKINKSIPLSFQGEKIFGLTNMKDIVTKASALAKAGDVVLLSPACASFGLFKNYKDRGDQFKKAVLDL